MIEKKPLTKKQLTALRKKDQFIDRMFTIKELLPQLINTHKQIYELIEKSLDTNKKDFDITINDKRFVSTIPFTKEEAKILHKQRKVFIRYIMSIFYKGLIKDKEDVYLILPFFMGANPQDYGGREKRKEIKRLPEEERIKFETKQAPLNKSALAEIQAEKKKRISDKEYDKLFVSYGNSDEK